MSGMLKKYGLWSCLIALLVLCLALIPKNGAILASGEMGEENKVRFFVGGTSQNDQVAREYREKRENLLQSLAEDVPETTMSAVIVFKDYLSVEKTAEIMESVAVERVCFWTPGETGRNSLYVESNDIMAAIDNQYKFLEENKNDEAYAQAANDYLTMVDTENYGIFSVTVSAPVGQLYAMTESEIIDFIDVKYSPESEEKALAQDTQVSYIELPYKPDGAL